MYNFFIHWSVFANERESERASEDTVASAKRRVTSLFIDYNPNLPNVGRILRDNLHILYSTNLMRDILPDKSIIPAFRRPKNLKEMLAPSKLKVQQSDN